MSEQSSKQASKQASKRVHCSLKAPNRGPGGATLANRLMKPACVRVARLAKAANRSPSDSAAAAGAEARCAMGWLQNGADNNELAGLPGAESLRLSAWPTGWLERRKDKPPG